MLGYPRWHKRVCVCVVCVPTYGARQSRVEPFHKNDEKKEIPHQLTKYFHQRTFAQIVSLLHAIVPCVSGLTSAQQKTNQTAPIAVASRPSSESLSAESTWATSTQVHRLLKIDS